MTKRITIFCFLVALYSAPAISQISLVQFSSGYQLPVDIKNCGDDRLFIVEQRGKIRIADTAGVLSPKPFLDITSNVVYSSEQGLLGLAFAPDFLTSGYFYVDYTMAPTGATHISRFHVDALTPDSADPSSEEVLLTIYQPYSNHNGGGIAFGPDGYLYFGMGDGGSGGDPGNRAQNPDSLLGKILRIAVNPPTPGYTIPPTNPFAQDTTLGRGEIYTMGMRNPWRWSFDPLTDDLWIGDVGQNAIEEVDFQPAGSPSGLNYGWRCYEANQPYNTSVNCLPYSSYVPPVYQYPHAGGMCSITGGYIYRGTRFQELYGKYFFTDYCNSQIQYLVPNGTGGFTNTNLGSLGAPNISTFGVDRHGELYCAAINTGNIYHFVSANCSPVATINLGTDTIDDCNSGTVDLSVPAGQGYDYMWIFNGDTVSTLPTYTVTQAGQYIIHVANQACTNSDTVYVKFSAPLNVTFAGLDTFYCYYHTPVNLLPNYLGGTFSGPGITNATFSPVSAGLGDWDIIYSYTNSYGCSSADTQSVHVDACLSVPENIWSKTISVYPNPTQGDFYIHSISYQEKRINMEIKDVTGRTVWNEEVALNSGDTTFPVHTSIAKGVYIIRFSDEQSSASFKMIIQ